MSDIIPEFETNNSRDEATHGSLIISDKSGKPHVIRVICPYLLEEKLTIDSLRHSTEKIDKEKPFFLTADKNVSANYTLSETQAHCSSLANIDDHTDEKLASLLEGIEERLMTEMESKLNHLEINKRQSTISKTILKTGRVTKTNRYPSNCTLKKKCKEMMNSKAVEENFRDSIVEFLDVPYDPKLSVRNVRGINLDMSKHLEKLNIRTVDNLLKFTISIRNSRKYFAKVLSQRTNIDRPTLKELMNIVDNFIVRN
ncbi:hypothetical protein SNEBB_009994 [Seison nebaliae]|nr:hypothetical protein SNEBB_009994 [Seison nebaliae]